jgi:hypothetical protein
MYYWQSLPRWNAVWFGIPVTFQTNLLAYIFRTNKQSSVPNTSTQLVPPKSQYEPIKLKATVTFQDS